MSNSTFCYFANRSPRFAAALAVFLLAATAVQARDWVDFTVAGCKVLATDEPLENFPVAVRISTARIKGFRYSDIASTNDLLFSSLESKDPYPYEVETWNPAGESVIWVRLPSLRTNTQFRMSFNLPARPENPNPTDVWTAATYNGVWHMGEATTVHDSSTASRTMTVTTSRSHGVVTNEAKVGAAFYSRSNSASDAPDQAMKTGAIYMGYQSDCTLTGWINLKGFTGTNSNPFGPYKVCNTYYWSMYPGSSWTKTILRFKTTASTTAVANLAPKSAGWFHYAIVIHKKAAFDLYVNGEYAGSHTPGNEGYYKYNGELRLYVTGRPGYLDETRLRDVLSSDAWIRAEYDSVQNKDFVVAGPVQRSGKLILYVQ